MSYLPLFYEDLDEKVTYITEKLNNPKAANDLLDKVESAIMERLPLAESFDPYQSVRERRYSYCMATKKTTCYAGVTTAALKCYTKVVTGVANEI